MEFEILYAIQGMHNAVLDSLMLFFTTLGDGGILWIASSVILVIPNKTRKCGLAMMGAMALSFLLGNLIIKNIVQRARPCTLDTSVKLLIPLPRDYSFPSGHTLNGFTAATVIFCYYKRWGVLAYVGAAMIAFSRMYLFVHFPTDILGGIILGIGDGVLMYKIIQKVYKKGGSAGTVLDLK